jgi:hypothetical protein
MPYGRPPRPRDREVLTIELSPAFFNYLDEQFALTRRLILMATQADIDAITTKLGELKATLVADDSAIQQEIKKLQEQHPALDLTALQDAVDDVSKAVDDTTALVPTEPTEPTPTETDVTDSGATGDAGEPVEGSTLPA